MSSALSADEIRLRLAALLRRAKGLHGDVNDRRIRRDLRGIVVQIQGSMQTLDEDESEKARLAAIDLLEALDDRVARLDPDGRWLA